MPRGSPEIAKHARKGGQARQRSRLSLDRVEEAFGELQTLDDPERRLERLGVWAAAGMLAGSVAGAAVRSIEVWIRVHESKLTEAVVEELKADVDRIKDEIKRRPGVKAP